MVSFRYDPLLVEKVKTIEDRKWHPAEKYWSVPYSEGIVEKIKEVFEGEDIKLDPSLFGGAVETPSSSHYDFEDLRKELISRKYSRKTIKGYLYFNRDFLSFTGKRPDEVREENIKNYLVYLADEKDSAASTLNQAINALKFYYGSMLKKKFLYEIKRPRKDKKLPTVLSQEEVVRILTSLENLKHRTLSLSKNYKNVTLNLFQGLRTS